MNLILPQWLNRIGVSLAPEDAGKAEEVVRGLLAEGTAWSDRLRTFRDEVVFNIGGFGTACGEYILSRLVERAKKARESKEKNA